MSGSVTSPTGSVSGYPTTGLQDAETDYWSASGGTYDTTSPPVGGGMAQAQNVVMLSDQVGACGRHASGYGQNEITIRFSMVALADLPNSVATIPPAADLPLTFTSNTWLTTSDGADRIAKPYFMRSTKSGGSGTLKLATAGTVTFTQMDASLYAGSYDLWWGSDHATGQFSAPWC